MNIIPMHLIIIQDYLCQKVRTIMLLYLVSLSLASNFRDESMEREREIKMYKLDKVVAFSKNSADCSIMILDLEF